MKTWLTGSKRPWPLETSIDVAGWGKADLETLTLAAHVAFVLTDSRGWPPGAREQRRGRDDPTRRRGDARQEKGASAQAVRHVLRSDCRQISAHPSERKASWISARLSYRTRRRRK